MNNGNFWRADKQGQLWANYTITQYQSTAFVTVDIPVNIPIAGNITDINAPAITIPGFDTRGTLDIGILAGNGNCSVPPHHYPRRQPRAIR